MACIPLVCLRVCVEEKFCLHAGLHALFAAHRRLSFRSFAYMPDSPAILLIAYGSCNAQGLAAYRRFESRVRNLWPGMPVRWAYTSPHIRTRLASQVRLKSDSVTKALNRLALEHFGPIAAQPLQVIAATENLEVEDFAREFSAESGTRVCVGQPLLSSDADVLASAEAMMQSLPEERLPDEDVVLMGHGAKHFSQRQYTRLSELLHEYDANVHLVTMSGDVTLDDLLNRLTSHRVWLMPFLAAVGRHTILDMAGQKAESWLSRIRAAGHDCVPVIQGLMERKGFSDIWLDHLRMAMAEIVSPTV